MTGPGSGSRGGVDEVLEELGDLVADGAADRTLDRDDFEAAVDATAAMLSAGYGAVAVGDVAELIGETTAHVRSLDLPADARRPVDRAQFGVLIPVLSGSPGSGASVLAAAITDAVASATRRVLLVDAADPARSGLASAASGDGPSTQVGTELRIRCARRGHALVVRLGSTLPVVTPGMVPPPPLWLPGGDPVHATVVDLGHDGWRATANPLSGAGAWLRRGTPAPRPVLVVRPTRPSLRHAEQVLARLAPWVELGTATPPCRLVVNGARRWPPGVVDAAGPLLTPLVESAVFVPHDYDVEVDGVTEELLGSRLRRAVAPMLGDWGLPPEAPDRNTGSWRSRG